MASAVYLVCWGNSTRVGNTNRIDKLIRNTGFVANWTIEAVVERRSLNKVLFIMGNPAQEVEHLL